MSYHFPAGAISAINLGPVGGVPMGVFAVPNSESLSAEHTLISTDGRLSPVNSARLANWFGVASIAATTIPDAIFELLTVQSDPTGSTRCKPLVPTRVGEYQVHLGGKIVAMQLDRLGTAMQRAVWERTREVVRVDLESLRNRARAGGCFSPVTKEVDPDYHRRILTGLIAKYGASFEELKPDNWPSSETPLARQTVITESFTATDSATDMSADLTWANVIGVFGITSNRGYCVSTGGVGDLRGFARAESDLSTSDHYAQCDITGLSGAFDNRRHGPTVRNNAADEECYAVDLGGAGAITLRHNSGTGTETTLDSDTVTLSLPDTVRIDVSGSSLEVFFNGVSTLTATDTAISGNTRCGMCAGLTVGTGRNFDTWSAGDLGGSSPIVGSGLLHSTKLKRVSLVG